MKYHIIAFSLGFLLDLILGDPYCLPHPIRLIGKLIANTEKFLRQKLPNENTSKNKSTAKTISRNKNTAKTKTITEFGQGIILVLIVIISVVTISLIILFAAYHLHPHIGTAVECIMTYQILAAKCLKVESMKVYKHLKSGNLNEARTAVSMIVGRDTNNLNEEGIAKAAIETVAENTSDGVIAPMLYLAIGGPVLGFFYKAVNTMDSMVGYKNDKYLYFGRAAAKLDDFINFIPSRISAFLMIIASFLLGSHFSGKNALAIYKRDRRKHASPNSAQTESVCAGALGIRLAGDASYFGKIVKKPYIGEAIRKVEYEDIKLANRLMYTSVCLCEIICILLLIYAYNFYLF